MENPFKLSDEKLNIVLDSYTSWLEKEVEEKLYPETQRQRDKDIKRTFLSKSYLEKKSDEELIEKVRNYSRSLEGPVQIRLGDKRLTDQINNIRRNLLYLIDSKDEPFTKAANIIDGKYKIQFFSRSFWTPIFNSIHPKDLPNWNNKTDRFLIKLGVTINKRGLKFKEKYKLISDSFKYLNKLDPQQDFFSLNHLMHYGTEIQEGKDLIRSMTGVIGEEDISYWRIIQPYREKISVWPTSRD